MSLKCKFKLLDKTEGGTLEWSIINLEHLISISNVSTFYFKDQCLIHINEGWRLIVDP